MRLHHDRYRLALCVLVLGCLASAGMMLSASAIAAPGDLDPSFSLDGLQTTDFGSGNAAAADVAVQPDGKIVVVGRTDDSYGPTDDFAVARYNADGSLDTTFSGDGKQTTDFGGLYRDEANGG